MRFNSHFHTPWDLFESQSSFSVITSLSSLSVLVLSFSVACCFLSVSLYVTQLTPKILPVPSFLKPLFLWEIMLVLCHLSNCLSSLLWGFSHLLIHLFHLIGHEIKFSEHLPCARDWANIRMEIQRWRRHSFFLQINFPKVPCHIIVWVIVPIIIAKNIYSAKF